MEPDYQGRGVGKRLMLAIERYFSDVTQFDLFTGHKSVKDLRLYNQLGYTEVRRDNMAPGLDLVFLSKSNRAAVGSRGAAVDPFAAAQANQKKRQPRKTRSQPFAAAQADQKLPNSEPT